MTKRPKKTGRPSTFSQAIADEVCARLSRGEPLAAICRDETMPGARTVYDWMDARPELSAAIARAREVGFDVIALDCLDIADDSSRDTKLVGRDGDEREVCDTEFVQRSKLRIDTRLKLLAKWDPKRYGDKIEHAGNVGVTLVMQDLDEQL